MTGSTFERINFDHVVRVIPHLCFSKTRDTEIAFPVDVLHLAGKNSCRFRADSFVDFFVLRQPFFEMNKRSIRIKAFKKGNGADFRIDPDQDAPSGSLVKFSIA